MENRCYDIKEIQKKGLQILKEVDAICKKHNIKYFLDSGTLLGAVRHKGFIPWDDDVDLAMLREDYEKFLKVSIEELPEQYFVQTNDSDKHFPFGFARILDMKSKYLDDKNKFKTGLTVDVFPIDNAYDNRIMHNISIFMIKTLQGLAKSKITLNMSNYNGIITKIMVFMSSLAGKLFSTRFLIKAQKMIAISNNHKNAKYKCFYSYSFNYLNRLFPSEVFNEIELLEFEGHMFPGPKGWDKVLTIIYGDYMTMPSIDERVPKHAQEQVVFLD